MKKTLLLLMVIMVNLVVGQTATFQWAGAFGGPSNEGGSSIATDAIGNVYTVGAFQNTVDFDPGFSTYNLTANGMEPFITKLDPAGNFLWAKKIDCQGGVAGYVKLDGNGNIYIAGTIQYYIDLDPGPGTNTVNSLGLNDVFIIKLDNAGNFIWGKTWGSTFNDDIHAIALDASGNLYSAGNFQGVADLDPGAAVANYTVIGQVDAYVSKLDVNGNFVWAKQFSGTSASAEVVAHALSVDASGNIYTSGLFDHTVDFDPGAGIFLVNSNNSTSLDIFVHKLDNNGNLSWVKTFKQTSTNAIVSVSSILSDASGNIYSSGNFQGTFDFDPSASVASLTAIGSGDIYINKLDMNGNYVWVKQIAGNAGQSSTSMAMDANNDLYLTGGFAGVTDFDPSAALATYTSSGSYDVFITKFNSNGGYIWNKQFGGIQNDGTSSIHLDANYNILTTGYFSVFADFDPGPATYNIAVVANQDAFVHKMKQCFAPSTPVNTTPTLNLTICEANSATLTASSNGTISWYPTLSSSSALGTGTLFTTPILSAGSYTYYTEASTCTTSIARTAITVSVMVCTGINSPSNLESLISVYPNPSNGIYTIELNSVTTIVVTDLLGKVINTQQLNAGKHQLNLSTYKNGTYILKAESNGLVKRVKLVKE